MYETVSVDFSSVNREINSLSNHIDNCLNSINNDIRYLNNNMNNIGANVVQLSKELAALSNAFKQMQNEQKHAEALQRAISELIRIRQELDQRFGTQKLVRDHMLGILQANDLALITKSTISQCTEELMISAPRYWLAPALVALAAWISDNKSLADRAVREAIKRDAEKTYLLFALITRRVNAGRLKEGKKETNVCFLWLAKYFEMQDPRNMTQSIIAYVDCYSSGVFGIDKDNICDDQIHHWLDEIISSNKNFAEEQKDLWLKYFKEFVNDQIPKSEDFKALKQICPNNQYDNMINYYSNIKASEDPDSEMGIKSWIKKIKDEPVDKDKLLNEIDEKLIELVNNIEEDEVKLRREEKYLQYVKESNGDEEEAKRKMKKEDEDRKFEEITVDFVERLNKTVKGNDASPSARKTALMMVKPYIKEAYNEFIHKYKDAYPSKISLEIKDQGNVIYGKPFTWNGYTQNCENKNILVRSLMDLYNKEKNDALSKIDDATPTKIKEKYGVLRWFLWFLIYPIKKYNNAVATLEKNERDRKAIISYYNQQQIYSVNLLTKALSAREVSNKQVQAFRSDENSESIDL